jgi:large subunit ribosomal protein L15
MHMSDLSPTPGSVHKKKRVGRGNSSGHGTTAGRGTKGQQSRSGRDLRIGFEGGQIPLIRALSRKRGFNNKWRTEYEPVNLASLASIPAGTNVTLEMLRSAGVVKSSRLPVKVLGDGELTVAITVEAHRFSASARSKIEAAGGKVIELTPRKEREPEVEAAPEAPAAPTARRSRARKAEAEEDATDAASTPEADEPAKTGETTEAEEEAE